MFKQGQRARLFRFHICLWQSPVPSDYYFLTSIYILGKVLNHVVTISPRILEWTKEIPQGEVPGGPVVTKSPANCSGHGFDPRSRKIPGGTKPVATAPESVGSQSPALQQDKLPHRKQRIALSPPLLENPERSSEGAARPQINPPEINPPETAYIITKI